MFIHKGLICHEFCDITISQQQILLGLIKEEFLLTYKYFFLSRYLNNCRGIRSSKFKHVYGLPAKKPHCYDNLKITRNASDANFCAVNPKFLACVIEVGGGGSFIVLPLDEKGRVPHSISKVSEL